MKSLIVVLALLLSLSASAGPKRVTYTANRAGIIPPATPTDICKISGSATKTVYVTGVRLSSTQTTAGINTFFLIKRSADDTGGTRALMTIVPHDSQSAASGASVASFTANPTAGTLVGLLRAIHVLSPAPASVVPSDGRSVIYSFNSDDRVQPVTLRGTGETLAISFNGAALPTGLSVACGMDWFEE